MNENIFCNSFHCQQSSQDESSDVEVVKKLQHAVHMHRLEEFLRQNINFYRHNLIVRQDAAVVLSIQATLNGNSQVAVCGAATAQDWGEQHQAVSPKEQNPISVLISRIVITAMRCGCLCCCCPIVAVVGVLCRCCCGCCTDILQPAKTTVMRSGNSNGGRRSASMSSSSQQRQQPAAALSCSLLCLKANTTISKC